VIGKLYPDRPKYSLYLTAWCSRLCIWRSFSLLCCGYSWLTSLKAHYQGKSHLWFYGVQIYYR